MTAAAALQARAWASQRLVGQMLGREIRRTFGTDNENYKYSILKDRETFLNSYS